MKLSIVATLAAVAVVVAASPAADDAGGDPSSAGVYIAEQDATCTVNGSGDILCVPGKVEATADNETRDVHEKRIFGWLFGHWWNRWDHNDGNCWSGDQCFIRCARRSYGKARCGGYRNSYNCYCHDRVDYHNRHSHVYRGSWWW